MKPSTTPDFILEVTNPTVFKSRDDFDEAGKRGFDSLCAYLASQLDDFYADPKNMEGFRKWRTTEEGIRFCGPVPENFEVDGVAVDNSVKAEKKPEKAVTEQPKQEQKKAPKRYHIRRDDMER